MKLSLVDRHLKTTIFIALLFASWAFVSKAYNIVFFDMVMIVAYVAANILIPLYIKSIRHQVIALFIFGIVIGFPIFYLTNHFFPETKKTSETVQQTAMTPYQTVTSQMIVTSAEEVESVLSTNKHVVLYMGRESCPFCLQFVEKMRQIPVNTIYYMDAENKSEAMYSFAHAHGITSIPQLLYFNNGELVDKLTISEETTSNQIQAFILRNE